jgi:hypothetical protein
MSSGNKEKNSSNAMLSENRIPSNPYEKLENS